MFTVVVFAVGAPGSGAGSPTTASSCLRTVRNPFQGNGPVFNMDERVEANTSTNGSAPVCGGPDNAERLPHKVQAPPDSHLRPRPRLRRGIRPTLSLSVFFRMLILPFSLLTPSPFSLLSFLS